MNMDRLFEFVQHNLLDNILEEIDIEQDISGVIDDIRQHKLPIIGDIDDNN